jgi:hypothetical protein
MKTLVISLFLALCSIYCFSQQGRVNIEQDPGITKMLSLYKTVNSETNFYTIQVGFGSYEKAEELKSDVGVDFPGWYSKIIFDSPTYRVHVGRFRTKLEAEREYIEVRKKYPESLLLSPK